MTKPNSNKKNGSSPKQRFVGKKICPEFNLTDKEAELVGKELLRLGARPDADGVPIGVDAKQLVRAARSKSSPLHKHIFAKSDADVLTVARELLARKLIHSVRVVLVFPNGDEERQQVMVSVKPTPDEPRTYVPTADAVESEYMTEQRVANGVSRLNGWLDEFRAFRHADGLAPLWNGVRELLIECEALDDEESRVSKLNGSGNGKRSHPITRASKNRRGGAFHAGDTA